MQTNTKLGKRVGGKSGDSSLYLDVPKKAVINQEIPVHMEQGSPTVSIEIEDELKTVIIDTGSIVSILQPGCQVVTLGSPP
jgi:hypothetical protein